MNLSYYDFSPGILGLIIWGIISYLLRKKKIKNKPILEREQVQIKEESHDLDYFKNILEPQKMVDFSPSILINESTENIEPQEDVIDEDLSILMDESFKDISIPLEIDAEEIPKQIDRPLIVDSKKRMKTKVGLPVIFEDKNSLKSAFIMKEILDKPLSLRSYD